MSTTIAKPLNPYDTGERGEPHLWIRNDRPGAVAPDKVDADDYGRVDFDTDEGGTIVTLHVRRAADSQHQYELSIDQVYGEPLTIVADGRVLAVVDETGRDVQAGNQ